MPETIDIVTQECMQVPPWYCTVLANKYGFDPIEANLFIQNTPGVRVKRGRNRLNTTQISKEQVVINAAMKISAAAQELKLAVAELETSDKDKLTLTAVTERVSSAMETVKNFALHMSYM